MEVEGPVSAATGEFHKRVRGAQRWRNQAVEVRRQVNLLAGPSGYSRTDEGGGQAGEHLRPVKGERLWAEEGRARGVEYMHAHVIGIGPHAYMGIIEEVG